jgi:broad specificity phosphatase PhoE
MKSVSPSRNVSIILVRHGESYGNVNGDVTGSDPELTDLGKQQAYILTDLLQHYPVEAIYASDLHRARQTAEIIADRFHMKHVTETALRERYFGAIEGLTHDEIIKRYGSSWNDFYSFPHELQMTWKLVPDMESYDEVFARFSEWFEHIAAKHAGTVIAVSHANVMLTLLTHLGFARLSELPRGSIENTAYLRIEQIDGVWNITETRGIHKK